MKKKIIRNTIIIITLVTLLTFSAVTALMYNHAVNVLTSGTEHEAEIIRLAVENNGTDFLKNVKLTGQTQRITLINPSGMVIYDSDVDEETLDNHKMRPEVSQAIYKGVGTSMRNSDTMDVKVYYYAVRLTDGNILRVSSSMDSIYSMMADMVPYMLLILAVIICIAVIIIRVETERMVRPINDINLNHPLEEPTYEELTPLLTRMDVQNKRIQQQMEELKQAEGMRREFSANVSHELKTPLMAISGYAEIISCNMVKSEDIPEFAGRIYKEAARMTTMIEDIIKLSHLDEKSDTMPFESVDLKEVTDAAVDSLQVVARKRGIRMTVAGDVPPVEGVRQIIYEMLHNLCDNAVKYNRDGGSVHICMEMADPEGQHVRWSVKDTGIGIPKDEQERIFERFYRVDKSHSRETEGTGLGLSIVKHGAILHDAQVSIESEPDVGTCITIIFPVKREI
ncbi:ATP-binding protein [Frisingicoccus sp.]|uniref:sensor histidine kinase n=1 Tax=Frisingicoccus sp. TaxID=1918627 RepID=UPI00386AFE9F